MNHLARHSLILVLCATLLVAMGPPFPKGELRRIPGWSTGLVPDFGALQHELSANGRWAVLESRSMNLIPGGSDFSSDIFLHDVRKDVVIRASNTATGGDPVLSCVRPNLSAKGRYVVYDSSDAEIAPPDINNASDVFLFDRKKGTTERISVTSDGAGVTGFSTWGDVSKNGRLVVFESSASQLVPGDTNNENDIFLRDRKLGTTTRLSLASDGSEADEDCICPVISDNGRFVAFTTKAALVPEDTNGYEDVYVVDLKKGTIQRASVSSDGSQGELVEGAVLAPRSGPTISISANGRYLAFNSDAKNLDEGDDDGGGSDVLLRDLKKGTTVLVSKGSDGVPGNSASTWPAISPEGRFVAFQSYSTNLSGDDTNLVSDIYLRDRKKGTTELISQGPDGTVGNLTSSLPSLSKKGKWIGFRSEATNLLATDDGNANTDVFLRRR